MNNANKLLRKVVQQRLFVADNIIIKALNENKHSCSIKNDLGQVHQIVRDILDLCEEEK